ncbi:alpha/beta hydrolase [Tolypothrix sp. FACHB-123]|uniref:alpha/beta hydrolase n=1 Tax=Tolypothrix sp. FACHB-123 TaxID=2692868 RepID=UPI001685FE3E|nr:alpha/beta hydrolase [Tolypothrix sp. FACHB-123]MBD2353131.1 alpha/beta hydrolase [Tolypothrix sp. FACHB-123]
MGTVKIKIKLLASIVTLLYTNSAIAAEKVTLKYGIFRPSISVDELTKLAQTGEVSQSLNFYLTKAGQNPKAFRNILSQEVNADPILLDRLLNNPIGEFLLDRIGQSVSTSSGEANRQALRSAIILSANKDNKVSLIEIIQNYPTTEVVVDGERLAQAYRQLYILGENLQRVLPTPR